MKQNKIHDSTHLAEPKLVAVHFEFTHPTAVSVCIAGSFNDWHPTAKPMHSAGAGNWQKETSLAHGVYEYCLVVDGEWMPDPLAKGTVPNPFGGRNSILEVAGSLEAAHCAEAAGLPLKDES